MRRAHAWLWVSLSVSLWVSQCGLLTRSANASDTNYQNYISGGRSAGLGGAYTAIANDPSGLLFNPAGIVDDRHTDFSLSANLYGFERSERGATPPSPIPDLNDLSQVATDLVVIPSLTGLVRTFQKDPNGEGYLNAIGLVMLVPSFRESTEQLVRQGNNGLIDYKRRNRDRLFMPGVGYARKLGERWRVGISTFFNLRMLESSESIVSSISADPEPFRFADSTVSLSAGALQWVLGVKWFASDAWQLGLSFSPPSVPVYSSSQIRYYRGAYEPNTDPNQASAAFDEIRLSNLPSVSLQPAVLRFGTAFVDRRHFTVSADVTLQFPTQYDLLPASLDAQRGMLPFVARVNRAAVVNINIGGEWMFAKHWSLSGGFYTDFASSQTLSGPAFAGLLDQPSLASIDYFGFTGALGYFSNNTLTRAGVLYAFGKGYDVVTRDEFGRLLQQRNQFERIEVSKSFFYIFVSSGVRFD